jgi:hypothetical protein
MHVADARAIVGACDAWPPQSVLNQLPGTHAATARGAISSASRLAAELAAALPPCTARSKVTELCFGRHSGLATALVGQLYPSVGHLLAALSHTHACSDLYFHSAGLLERLGVDRFEIVQFDALRVQHMTARSRDILPRVDAQSLVISMSLLQSLVETHHLLDRAALEAALRWVSRYVGVLLFCSDAEGGCPCVCLCQGVSIRLPLCWRRTRPSLVLPLLTLSFALDEMTQPLLCCLAPPTPTHDHPHPPPPPHPTNQPDESWKSCKTVASSSWRMSGTC